MTILPSPDEPVTYPVIRRVVHRYLGTVRGIGRVLDYEPAAIQASPLIYTLLDRVTTNVAGQVETRIYGMIHRLAVKWQDNESAEVQLSSLLDPVFDALRQAQRTKLDGLLERGLFDCADARAGYYPIGGALHRVVDFATTALVKGAHTRHWHE